MGLSASKKDLLESRNFHKLFLDDKQHKKWIEAAVAAQAYAKANVTHGEEPRPDDVADALLPILHGDTDFLAHGRKNSATSRKYTEAFADLIVDQVLIEPTRHKENNDGAGRVQKEFGDS